MWQQAEKEVEKVLQKQGPWIKDGLDEGNFFIFDWEPFEYYPKMGGHPGLYHHAHEDHFH